MRGSVCLAFAVVLLAADVRAVDLSVSCEQPGSWKIESVKTAEGPVEEFAVRLTSPVAAEPPRFALTFDVPQVDAYHKWLPRPSSPAMPPNWSCTTDSRLCRSIPLVAFLNGDDRSRICVAVSEAKRTVRIDAGLREEDCRIVWKIDCFSEPEAALSAYEMKLRIDRRDVFFGDAIRDGVDWIERSGNLVPMSAPAAAFDPLYSTWYSFHQNVTDREIETECAEAAKLGMKTLIVDDGWQTDDNSRGYRFAGDWEISKRRFPDMAAHVARVQSLGMKYMMWYGLPMMGFKAKNYERFKGKYLFSENGRWEGFSCLDPRFPEVRDYLCGIYERAVKEWNIDGLKLDFIDRFGIRGTDPAVRENYAGRDIKSVPEAVDRLLADVRARLTALKPDFLFEFRQSYIGPVVRQYGNMLRASDCPGDLLANRCRIANLRLTSGRSAVHADPLEWNTSDTAESAARFVLATIFSTIQYSVMLRTLPESHKRMIAHWLAFSQTHRETLLRGDFRPHHYEANYPWMEAESAAERIACVYVDGMTVPVDVRQKPCFVLDGTGKGRLVLDLASSADAVIYDTYGKKTSDTRLEKGLVRVPVPVSGYLKLQASREESGGGRRR